MAEDQNQDQRINWFLVSRLLFKKSRGRILPADVGEMTLAEVYVLLAGDDDFDANGSPRMGKAELLEHNRRLCEMTPAQQLRDRLQRGT